MKLRVYSVAPDAQVPAAAVPLEAGHVKHRVSLYQHVSELVRAMSLDARSDGLEGGGVRIAVQDQQ